MIEQRIANIGPLLKELRAESLENESCCEALTIGEAIDDEICDLERLPVIDPEKITPVWRHPDKNPPEVEEEVLVLYRNEFGEYGITTGHYENGNIFSEDSKWNWIDLCDWGTYDEELDDYRIPEGWWEERHFNPDDVYNNQIDMPVVGWMPLPPKEVAQ